MFLPVDTARFTVVGTGLVSPVPVFVDGRPKQDAQGNQVQAVADDSSKPLWGVEVVWHSLSWGRPVSEMSSVTVAAALPPALPAFQPLAFDNLCVDVSSRRDTTALSTRFTADAVRPAGQAAPAKGA